MDTPTSQKAPPRFTREQREDCVPAGTMLRMNGNLFHTLQDNTSEVTRINLFSTSCPSWVCETDREVPLSIRKRRVAHEKSRQ